MIHSIQIGALINARLTQDSTLAGLVGNGVFPIVAENGTNYPFVVYTRTSVTPKTMTKDGVYEDTVTFQVSAISNSYNQSIVVADRVRELLEMRMIDDGSIVATDIYMSGISERWEGDAYIQQMQFTCSVHNSTRPPVVDNDDEN